MNRGLKHLGLPQDAVSNVQSCRSFPNEEVTETNRVVPG